MQHVSKITVDNTTYTVCWDFRAMTLIKELTGENPLDDAFADPDPERLVAMFYATIHAYHPNISYDQVKSMITISNFIDIHHQLMDAFYRSAKQNKMHPDYEEESDSDEKKSDQKPNSKNSGQ